MKAHTPQQTTEASRRRSSITASHRTSMGGSLPRPLSRIAIARASNTQPTFDFMTGAERPPSRDAFRSSARRPSIDVSRQGPPAESEQEREKRRRELDELKAEVKTLRYTIDNSKQEEELAKLRHESELREARRKGEEDFKKMQAAEAERSKAVRQHEYLLKELTEVRNDATNEKAALEKRAREFEESKRLLEEEIEDMKSEREESMRSLERKLSELETRNETLQRSVEELQEDSDRREALLQEAQQQLVDKDAAYGALEAEVLRLKAQNGDAETLGIIKRELSEQVAHIRKLEITNREQAAELNHLKRLHKGIEVVEEEKRSLQRKLEAREGLENELAEAHLQRQRLEDERLAWTAYLESQAGPDGQIEFDSPEALARAFIAEQYQTATLVERIGSLEPELSEKDSKIRDLEFEKAQFAQEIEKLRTAATSSGNTNGSSGSTKIQQRLERQKALAIKEVEYLREQLKAYDTEDTTFQPESVDEAKIKRIQELEDMVDQYRREVQTLSAEISMREPAPVGQELTGTKRQHSAISEDSEVVGQLTRKNRKLQDELSTVQSSTKLLKKEISVLEERLTVATKRNSTRILALRSNPTSDFEAIKQATLDVLKKENAELLAQIQSKTRSSAASSVPMSSLQAAQLEIQEMETKLESKEKQIDRMRKVWALKTNEFRESLSSILGWDVMFIKEGTMKVTSKFHPSKEDEENSITFDGHRGTMKISGGTESAFAVKISDQTKFWVKERRSIPCFLAALTLEFYDEATKDGTRLIDI